MYLRFLRWDHRQRVIHIKTLLRIEKPRKD
jgi:hypothetical protein